MKCPKCNNSLDRVNVNRIEVDQCGACRGIWFDPGELNKILKLEDITALKHASTPDAQHDATRSHCPRCVGEGRMVPVKDVDHGIHIDTCIVCYGQWLDGGELEMLRRKGLFDTIFGIFRS